MSQPCNIVLCKQTARVLCHCCHQNLCLEHLSNHSNSINNSSLTQINQLKEQLNSLNDETLLSRGRQILDKWRDSSIEKVHLYHKEKCEELDRCYSQTMRQYRRELEQLADPYQKHDTPDRLSTTIADIKQQINAIEQEGIPINIRSLSIENQLITIGESKRRELDISTLSTPSRTLTFTGNIGHSLTSSDEFLLIDQGDELVLLDDHLTVIQQSVWEHGAILCMCWSSVLTRFIIITESSRAFSVDPKTLLSENIEPMNNTSWISCACSNTAMYLASYINGIVEFSLLPSFTFTRRWDPPTSCKKNESIKDIACDDQILALIIAPHSNKMVHLILRAIATFDQLCSIRLDIKHPSYQLPIRCCSLNYAEWLVSDANTSQLFQIGRDYKVKKTLPYEQRPSNIVFFASNRIVIRTESSLNSHELSL